MGALQERQLTIAVFWFMEFDFPKDGGGYRCNRLGSSQLYKNFCTIICVVFDQSAYNNLIDMRSTSNTAKFLLTSSIANVHSLSSMTCVLASLNKVTETSLFSGTAHTTTPLKGSFMVGSHGRGSDVTLRLRLVHTTLSLLGFLQTEIFQAV